MRHTDIYTVQDLLALPPPVWIIDHLLPQGLSILYGAPGSGKSFLALDWALSVSEGVPWQDRAVAQGPVVYIAGEGGLGIRQRVLSWMIHRSLSDLKAAYFLLSPLYVREEGVVEEFLERLEDMGEGQGLWPRLIIVDTLSRSFGGAEENSSEAMVDFINRLDELAQEQGTSVLVVHHSNAAGNRERGHSSLRGAADAMFEVQAIAPQGALQALTVRTEKQKDSLPADPIYLATLVVEESLVLVSSGPPPPVVRGPAMPQMMTRPDMLTLLGSHADGLTLKEWQLATGVPRTTFRRRVRYLLRESLIYKDQGRYAAMPTVVDLAIDDEDE